MKDRKTVPGQRHDAHYMPITVDGKTHQVDTKNGWVTCTGPGAQSLEFKNEGTIGYLRRKDDTETIIGFTQAELAAALKNPSVIAFAGTGRR